MRTALLLLLVLITSISCSSASPTTVKIEVADMRLVKAAAEAQTSGYVQVHNRGQEVLTVFDHQGQAQELAVNAQVTVSYVRRSIDVALANYPQARRALDITQLTPAAAVRNPAVSALAEIPASAGDVREYTVTVQNRQIQIAPDLQDEQWLFDGLLGGAFIRARTGERLRITLDNQTPIIHSLDTHVEGMGGTPQVAPNSRKIILDTTVPARMRNGFFYYHCETAPISEHIRRGMYGAVLVEDGTLPAVDRELYLSYFAHLAPTEKAATFGEIRAVSFNGRANGYVDHPIELKSGERVRMYLLNAGPLDAATLRFEGIELRGVGLGAQTGSGDKGTLQVLTSQGLIVDFTAPAPGLYPFYSTAAGHEGKGALGLFRVR